MKKSTSRKSASQKQGARKPPSKPRKRAAPVATGLPIVLASLSPNTEFATRGGISEIRRPVVWLPDQVEKGKPYKAQIANLTKDQAEVISKQVKEYAIRKGIKGAISTRGHKTKTMGHVLDVMADPKEIGLEKGDMDEFRRFVSYLRGRATSEGGQKAALRLKASGPGLCRPVTRSKRGNDTKASDKSRRVFCDPTGVSCKTRLPKNMKIDDLVERLLAYGALPSDLLTEYKDSNGTTRTKLKTTKQLIGLLGHLQRRDANVDKCRDFKHRARKSINDAQLKRLVESSKRQREALSTEGEKLAAIARAENKSLKQVLRESKGQTKRDFLQARGQSGTAKRPATKKAASSRGTRRSPRSQTYASDVSDRLNALWSRYEKGPTTKLEKLQGLISKYEVESRKEQNMKRLQQLVKRYRSSV